jgi:hypothetical protein
MRMLAAVLIAIAVLSFAGWAEATTLTGAVNLPTATRDYSPVEKVGCGGPGRCPYGRHWVCRPYGRCGCVSCGYGRPYVAPYAYRPYGYRRYRY